MKHEGFPMRVVSRRTGLSPHVIRAWERRYKVIQPNRSQTNRRLYSAEDIERLNLLQSAISSGHSIGRVSALTMEELRHLLATEASAKSPHGQTPSPITGGSPYLESCTEAVKRMDEKTFALELGRAGLALGQVGLMQKVVAPLLDRIGEMWRAGDLRVSHEHMASSVIRSRLGSMHEAFELSESAPRIVVTTPAGQVHEFGALLAANAASSEGWRVLYLGPNLPASEIAGAALEAGAKAVALSLVYPPNDAFLSAELKELRKQLGNDVAIIAGGRASASYSNVLQEISALRATDLGAFRLQLDSLR